VCVCVCVFCLMLLLMMILLARLAGYYVSLSHTTQNVCACGCVWRDGGGLELERETVH